ncbi:MAG: hypothetical protein JW749_05235 [Sedimentisphaerales bacterium]|nr:hypothetical protein [Sedimentisphaerales bacterium]
MICLFPIQAATSATGRVNYTTVYQQLEGFGAAGCYDAEALASHPDKEEIYDLFFRDLGLDVFRIKNTYDISASNINAVGQIVAAARQATRNPDLKLQLVPWSPPTYLKSTGALDSGTIKKDPNNNYMYSEYADWWLDSLTAPDGWSSVGISPDYISIQNEPDWGIQYQVCVLNPTENSSYAGYYRAFEAVFNRLDGNVSPMPKMLGPESIGFGTSQAYINALISRGQEDNIYGFSHHLYADGSFDNPDGMISAMQSYADSYGFKPLFQTEYGASGTPTFAHALLLAQHIHNSLVYEGVSSYYHWTLFRNGSYTTGGMVNLTPGGGYIVRDLYWFFKHYAYFTDPNWYRISASTSSSNLLMTAFKNPDCNELTIVVLNRATGSNTLKMTLNNFSPDLNDTEVYRSSSTEHWSYTGEFNPSETLTLPAQSITTINLTGTEEFTPGTGYISKCKIKAGKIQGEDSFTASGTFSSFSPDLEEVSQFDVNIISTDGNLIYAETSDFDVLDAARGIFKYKYSIPKGADGAITSLKLDFNKQNISIKAKNIDLTGLACPVELDVGLGDYILVCDIDETIVNGARKIIPTRLMRTYQDTLVVTKAKARQRSSPFRDSLSVKGEIALADINDSEPNLVSYDLNIGWGEQTFTVPAGNFTAKTGHRYKCSKIISDADDGLITASFDLNKCTFSLSVKEADSLDVSIDDEIPFRISVADFNETADVNLLLGH